MYLFAVKKKFFLQRCENGHVKHLGSEFHRRPDAAENARPEIMQHNVYDNFYKCNKNSSGDEIANVLVNDDIAHT